MVTLNRNEVYIAAIVGIRRNLESFNSPECNKVKNKDFGWHTDIEAACAELAFAKFRNVYWDFSVNTFKKPDVDGWQVRHTQHSDGKLILRPYDPSEHKYALVTGTSPNFEIRGGIYGHEAKIEEFFFKGFNGMPDCWMIPQESLQRILGG